MSQIIFVDMSNLAKRAFHTPAVKLTPDGLSATLVPVVLRMLRKLKDPYPGSELVAVFDGIKATELTRKHLFPSYKEDRRHTKLVQTPIEKSMTQYFFRCLENLEENLKFLGVHCLKSDYLEADLVIAAQVSEAETRLTVLPHRSHSMVVSADVDYATMIRPGVDWLRPTQKKGIKGLLIKYNSKNFQREFGVPPKYYPFVKLLQGDKSDGIPGVRGFGPVKALKKIKEICAESSPKSKSQLLAAICKSMSLNREDEYKKLMLFDLSSPSKLIDYLITKIPDNTSKGCFFRVIEPEPSFRGFRNYMLSQGCTFIGPDLLCLCQVFGVSMDS